MSRLFALLVLAVVAPLAFSAEPTAPEIAAPKAAVSWLPKLADGRILAQQRHQPIFVRVGTASCVWCRKLETQLQTPASAVELARWTLVSLDLANAEKEARTLAVGPTPALRILTPAGRVVASHDGYMPADELVAWLKKNHAAAAIVPVDELTQTGIPDAGAILRLIEELKKREPEVREAAIRRLMPYPRQTAKPVVQAFVTGTLQTKLGVLELLREWQAPASDFDPWRPETVTKEALQKLEEWAANPKVAMPGETRELTASDLEVVRKEISRLLAARDAEAAAIRERLARYGASLLPEIYAALKQATSDTTHERLTALRYRVVARDALVLRWPGGLDRIASVKAPVRHEAVKELARLVTQADEPLLLEIFGDTDPFVRELSLRTLHAVSGKSAMTSLTRMLKDPDPNVRAAVLKQLVETPSPRIVPAVAEYAATEPDIDLVVHAIRVLRAAGGTTAVEKLILLLQNSSWRVRAEAVEAIGECADNRNFKNEKAKAAAYEAIQKSLGDEDGFVVARAVAALKKADSIDSVEPLLQAAKKHPELVGEVIGALGYRSNTGKKALAQIREFMRHANPAVRTKAIIVVSHTVEDNEKADVLIAGLKDPVSLVRESCLEEVFRVLDNARSNSIDNPGRNSREKPATSAELDAMLKAVRAGKGQPAGFEKCIPLLEPLLSSESPEERLSCALTLVALGREKEALPVLEAIATKPGPAAAATAKALPWLPWENRLNLFRKITANPTLGEAFSEVLRSMTQMPDPRAAEPFWALVSQDSLTVEKAGVLIQSLPALVKPRYFSTSESPPTPERTKLVEKALEQAKKGSELQRLIGLGVLTSLDPKSAGSVAEEIFNADVPPSLRADAFQIMLLTRPKDEVVSFAVNGLSDKNSNIRKAAVNFLTVGTDPLRFLRGHDIHLDVNSDRMIRIGRMSGSPDALKAFVPWVPPGLDLAVLRDLLLDSDPMVAAGAGYLLALRGDSSGIPALTRYWQEHAQSDWDWSWGRLLTTAVVCLDDDAKVPLLEEIYRSMSSDERKYRFEDEVRDFYWIIRPLTGPNALQLRKTIRADVGMSNLWR